MARAPQATEIEELPEADRLDGFSHPRATVNLFGQDAAERTLLDAFASGRMHHGWLIAGAEGIGKATMAYRFAKYILAAPEDRDPFGGSLAIAGDVPAARQVVAQSSPGLLVLRRPYDSKAKRFRTEITVDEARRLKSFLMMTPAEGAWRAVIVDTADDLNIAAANALLKSLEEPPPRTIFLIVTSHPGRLLPTIRSRCRTLEMPALSEAALKTAIQQAIAASDDEQTKSMPAASDWDELQHLADGSVRRFLSLHAAGGLELHRRIAGLVAALPKVDWTAAHLLGDELSGAAAESRYELFFDLLMGHLARLIRAAASGDAARADDKALAQRLMPGDRLSAWAEAWQAVGTDKAVADSLNLDRKSLILSIFSRLSDTASKHR